MIEVVSDRGSVTYVRGSCRSVRQLFVAKVGGRNVYISALHVHVPRRVHRRSERQPGQSWRRRLYAVARVVRVRSGRAEGGAVRKSGSAFSRGNQRDWRGPRGSAYGGAGRSLGR